MKAKAGGGLLLALLSSSVIGCQSDAAGEAETDAETETGADEVATVTFVVDIAALGNACDETGGQGRLMTRRVDCFDPALPCTIAQDKPWIVGTSLDCSVGWPSLWRVEVTQTGRWETRFETPHFSDCFALDGAATTDVSRADLEGEVELTLALGPQDSCF